MEKELLRQAIEKPETAYKQINKLENCQEMLEKTGDNTGHIIQIQKHEKVPTKKESRNHDIMSK